MPVRQHAQGRPFEPIAISSHCAGNLGCMKAIIDITLEQHEGKWYVCGATYADGSRMKISHVDAIINIAEEADDLSEMFLDKDGAPSRFAEQVFARLFRM